MKKSAAAFWLIFFAILVGALVYYVPIVKETFDRRFEQAFRIRFMPICLGGNNTPLRRAICDCVIKKTLKQLSFAQLSDLAATREYVKLSITPACVEQESPKQSAGE